jgi:tetratricopeptide (TPR) repeat protein
MRNVGTNTAEKQKSLIQQGLNEKQSGNYLLASQLYDEAIDMGGQGYLASAYYSKGVLTMEQKQYDHALNCFQEAVSLDPEYEKAWVNLGSVWLAFNRHAEALDAFERAHELMPNQVYPLFNRAYSLNRLGRYREAYVVLKNPDRRRRKDETGF